MVRGLTAVIIGAGYSRVAGIPLAKEIFTVPEGGIYTPSKGAHKRFEEVYAGWLAWSAKNTGKTAEQFLQAIAEGHGPGTVSFNAAVEFISASIATPRGTDWPNTIRNPRYANSVRKVSIVYDHVEFWRTLIFNFNIGSVHTTNYDLLIERCLRPYPARRPYMSQGFHYGGFAHPQILTGNGLLNGTSNDLELTGTVPLFKLHGSLNWQCDGDRMIMHQDCRPAFRKGGQAAIVPPVVEKQMPVWLQSVWAASEEQLKQSSTWICCGYSMPEYDHALLEFFRRASTNSRLEHILIMDPFPEGIKERWQRIAPQVTIECLPGLPLGTEVLKGRWRNSRSA